MYNNDRYFVRCWLRILFPILFGKYFSVVSIFLSLKCICNAIKEFNDFPPFFFASLSMHRTSSFLSNERDREDNNIVSF